MVTNEVEHPSIAVRPAALLVDFIAHQPPPLDRTPDPSHQRRIAIITSTGSPGRVQTPHATWLIALTTHFTAIFQPALRAGSSGLSVIA